MRLIGLVDRHPTTNFSNQSYVGPRSGVLLALLYNYRSGHDAIRAGRPRRALPFRKTEIFI
jgi:hypothetical protein